MERAPQPLERRVAGCLDDAPVKGQLAFGKARHVAAPRGAAHAIELDLQAAHVAAEPSRGRAGGHVLQGGADEADLGQLAGRDLPHAGAPERLGHDEPQQLELTQRLPHGGLADTELLRHTDLDDPLPGRVGAVENALDQGILDLLAQHRAAHRHARKPIDYL